MPLMKAVQISRAGGDFEFVEKEIPQPAPGQVRIRVEACGICHSDAFVKNGAFPGIAYPRVPGHEVAGRIDAVGAGVSGWTAGQRVGVGWHGGHCHQCPSCRRGDFITCSHEKITGISFDGGYAEFMLAPQEALAALPDDLSPQQAAPLLCAGITTFNALRHSPARPGDLVAIQGIGGLGHLAVQFAARMGFHTVALSQGDSKRQLAHQLGAHAYVDTSVENPAEALSRMGGARVILATAPSSQAISDVAAGLAVDGQLLIVAAPFESIQISPLLLIGGRRSVAGWPSGTAADSEDTLRFGARFQALPMVETFPLRQAAQAYDRMISNQARFRVVLTMDEPVSAQNH